jgi:hypothetical protein
MAREWRTATASDLARGGALEILRAVPDTRESRDETWRARHAHRPVLTGHDIARGLPASGQLASLPIESAPVIAAGDVLVRALAEEHGLMTRVADDADAGALLGHDVHLLRADAARLDPWFLAGFLGSEDNLATASTGSTILHIQPGRLRVPLLPLEEQRRYGEAFRHIHELRSAARAAADLAEQTGRVLVAGLAAGALLPPDGRGHGQSG